MQIESNKVFTKIILGDNKKLKKIDISQTLAQLRVFLVDIMVDDNVRFLDGYKSITLEQENELTCQAIISQNKEIFLTISQGNLLVKVINQQDIRVHIDVTQLLAQLRQKLVPLVKSDFLFFQDDFEVDRQDEDEMSIEDLLNQDSISIKVIYYPALQQNIGYQQQPQQNNTLYQNITEQEEEKEKKYDNGILNNNFLNDVTNVEEILPDFNFDIDSQQKYILTQLFIDSEKMPYCSEKCLYKLIYYTVELVLQKKNQLQQSEDYLFKIDKELAELKKLVEEEEIHNAEVNIELEETFRYSKNQSWEQAKDSLIKILKCIRLIDIQELIRLVNESDKAIDEVKDKEIILLLGGSGSGKSTMIHYLAGSTMKQQSVNGLPHIGPVKVENRALLRIKSSPFAVSETRFISPVEIFLKDLSEKGGIQTSGSIIICDTPGFEDSRGPEIDIANGIGIIKVIKGCKSVRPVILIGQETIGQRGQGIRDLARTIIKMTQSPDQVFCNLQYVFTKFNEQERGNLLPIFKDIRDQIEKNDTTFQTFFNFMINTLTNSEMIFIDPTKNKIPGLILNKLLQRSPIYDPEDFFCQFVSSKSKAILTEQTRLHQQSIEKAATKNNFELAKYKLDELLFLYNLTEDDKVRAIYEECVRSLTKKINADNTNIIENFVRCFQHENTLQSQDIQLYIDLILKSQEYNNLRQAHLNNEIQSTEHLNEILSSEINLIDRKMKQQDIQNKIQCIFLIKLKMLSNYFELAMTVYNKKIIYIKSLKDPMINLFKENININDFQSSASILNQIVILKELYQRYLDEITFQDAQEQCKIYLIQYLSDVYEKGCSKILGIHQFSVDQISELKKVILVLESAKGDENYSFKPHISIEEIDLFSRSLVDKIHDYYLNFHNEIQVVFDKDKENSLMSIQHLFAQLVLIRTIPQLEEKTSQLFFSMQEQLCGYIIQLQNYIEQILLSLYADKTSQSLSFNDQKLLKCLIGLKNSAWIEQYKKGVYSDISDQVKVDIIKYILSLKEQLMKFNLGIDFYEQLKLANLFLQQINKLKILGDVIETVEEHIKLINNWFLGEVKKNIEQIEVNLNLQNCLQNKFQYVNGKMIKKSLNYIISCQEISSFQNLCDQLLINVRELFYAFEQNLYNEFNTNYQELLSYKERSDTFSLPKVNIAEPFRRLIQLQELKGEFKQVLYNEQTNNNADIFDQETLINNFIAELRDLQKLMTFDIHNGQYLQLNNHLLIVKLLSQLDFQMEPDNKFMNLYQSFREKIFTDAPDALQTAIKQVDSFQYQEVQSQLDQLDVQKDNLALSNNFTKLNNYLNNHIESLINDIISLANLTIVNFTPESIKPIIDILRKLEKAKQNIISKQLNDKISESLKEVKQIISQSMLDNLLKIESQIRIVQLKNADQSLKSLLLIQNQLSKYCTDEVTIKQKFLREMMKKVLEDKISHYEELQLESYFHYPPRDILQRLQQASEINIEYETAKIQIEEIIMKKLNNHLQNILHLKSEFDFRIAIQKIQSVIPMVSDSLQGYFKNYIVEYEALYNNKLQNVEVTLSDAINSKNSQVLFNLLNEFQKDTKNNRGHISKIKDFVIQCCLTKVSQAQELLKQGSLESSLALIKDIKKQQDLFQESFCEIGQLYEDVGKMVQKKFDIETKALIIFFNTNVSEEENEACIDDNLDDSYESQSYRRTSSQNMLNQMQLSFEKNITESFDLFINFIQLNQKQSYEDIINHFILDFDKQITEVTDKIANSFNTNGLKFNDALANKNIDQILFTLKQMKQWDSLYKKIGSLKGDLMSIPQLQQLVKLPKSYSQMRKDVIDQIKQIKDTIISSELINENTNKGKKNRDEYYYTVKQQLNYVKFVKKLKGHRINDVNLHTIENDCYEVLNSKVESLSDMAQITIKKDHLSFKDYQQFNMLINNLSSISQIIDLKTCNIDKLLKNIEQLLLDKVQKIAIQAQKYVNTNIEQLSSQLIQIKSYSKNIPSYQTTIDEFIEEILVEFKTQQRASGISKLGIILEKSEIGKLIVAEHQAFQGYNISIFNSKTQKYTIENILSALKGDQIQEKRLLQKYKEFELTYQGQVKKHLSPNFNIDDALFDLKFVLSKFTREHGILSFIVKAIVGEQNNNTQIEWNNNNAHNAIQLIAHIFAIWTLQNSQFFFEASGLENQQQYLFTPHPGQVISIFRILGIGFAQLYLQKNLVEIKTGEGKSVTLAVSAIVLALLGFDVYCACYSEYLSVRDENFFQDFFRLLDVNNQIKYGTFNSLSESIINAKGDIRNIVTGLITDEYVPQPLQQGPQRQNVLLVDEVDVFFSKEFYGEQYCAEASLYDQTINDLIDFIWFTRNQKLTLQQITLSPEYQTCFTNQRFKGWEFLIEEAVKLMLSDLKDFESDEYYVLEDKIGYKQQDNIIFNISKSYKTLFAYYFENERGKISIDNMTKYKRIGVKCGQFSFAEILNQFTLIMGVTGTLQMLSQMEKDIIQDHYKIQTFTYIPSVFGNNKLRFNENVDIHIRNQYDYYNSILQEIRDKLVGNNIDTQRAVLVFFENTKCLEDFSSQMNMPSMIDYLQILTEKETIEEKLNIIKHASAQGYVTLLTKEFGRGTDFISRDEIVNANGGVHVIQVFLSEEKSEEVQIKGRTARQGENGSYSMILYDKYLEKYGITLEDLEENVNDIYKLLDRKRNIFFQSQYQNNIDLVKQIRPEHNASMEFLKNIADQNIKNVKMYLYQQNLGPKAVASSLRTLVLMDATGSMSSLLQKAKNTISETFKRAYEVCKKFNIQENSFKVQMAVYRNYDCNNDILQHSSWESQPELLFQFLKTIQARGGIAKEAVEIGLQHANFENQNEKISQVILIGDAPSNIKSEIDGHRRSYNFIHPKFSTPTSYQEELQKLRNFGIPVHAFYVANWAKENFQEISAATGGRCESLDINSNLGAEMLTNLITEEILRKIGEQSGKAEAFVNEYRNTYRQAYI